MPFFFETANLFFVNHVHSFIPLTLWSLSVQNSPTEVVDTSDSSVAAGKRKAEGGWGLFDSLLDPLPPPTKQTSLTGKLDFFTFFFFFGSLLSDFLPSEPAKRSAASSSTNPKDSEDDSEQEDDDLGKRFSFESTKRVERNVIIRCNCATSNWTTNDPPTDLFFSRI